MVKTFENESLKCLLPWLLLCITGKELATSGQGFEIRVRYLCLQSTVLHLLAMKLFYLLTRKERTGKVGSECVAVGSDRSSEAVSFGHQGKTVPFAGAAWFRASIKYLQRLKLTVQIKCLCGVVCCYCFGWVRSRG